MQLSSILNSHLNSKLSVMIKPYLEAQNSYTREQDESVLPKHSHLTLPHCCTLQPLALRCLHNSPQQFQLDLDFWKHSGYLMCFADTFGPASSFQSDSPWTSFKLSFEVSFFFCGAILLALYLKSYLQPSD